MVSIVIPCYNAAPYVGEAIESALGQSYADTEVIVVNDGSTDSSQAAIDQYEAQIRTVTTENKGACHARNVGIEMARGEYIKFLDADDVLRLHTVEKQVEEMEWIDDERGVVYSDLGRMDEDGSGKELRSLKYQHRPDDQSQLLFLLHNNINTQCPLHRRILLEEVGGFDEKLPREQEYDLHLRLAMAGVRFYLWPGVSGFLRTHESESRIVNQSPLLKDPEHWLTCMEARYDMIADHFQGDPPLPFRKNIAIRCWTAGRTLLQQEGDRQHWAQKFYQLAQAINPNEVPTGNPLYNILVKVVGPLKAEKMLQIVSLEQT